MLEFNKFLITSLACIFVLVASHLAASETVVKKAILSSTDDKVEQLNTAMSELLKLVEAIATKQSESIEIQEKSIHSLRTSLKDQLQTQVKLERELLSLKIEKLETKLFSEIDLLGDTILKTEQEANSSTLNLKDVVNKEKKLSKATFSKINEAFKEALKEIDGRMLAHANNQSAILTSTLNETKSQIMAVVLPKLEHLHELKKTFDQQKMSTHESLIELNEIIKSTHSDIDNKFILQENKQTELLSQQRKTTNDLRNDFERMVTSKVVDQTVNFETKINALRAQLSNEINFSREVNNANQQAVVVLETTLKTFDKEFNEKLNIHMDKQSRQLASKVKKLSTNNENELQLFKDALSEAIEQASYSFGNLRQTSDKDRELINQSIEILNTSLQNLDEDFNELNSLAIQQDENSKKKLANISTEMSSELTLLRQTQLVSMQRLGDQIDKNIQNIEEMGKSIGKGQENSEEGRIELQKSILQLGEGLETLQVNVAILMEEQEKTNWTKRFNILQDSKGFTDLVSKREVIEMGVIIPSELNCGKLGDWLIENVPMRDVNRFFVRSKNGLSVCKSINETWSIAPVSLGEQSHVIYE